MDPTAPNYNNNIDLYAIYLQKFAYKNIREYVLVTISATKTISYPYEEKFLNRPGFENLT